MRNLARVNYENLWPSWKPNKVELRSQDYIYQCYYVLLPFAWSTSTKVQFCKICLIVWMIVISMNDFDPIFITYSEFLGHNSKYLGQNWIAKLTCKSHSVNTTTSMSNQFSGQISMRTFLLLKRTMSAIAVIASALLEKHHDRIHEVAWPSIVKIILEVESANLILWYSPRCYNKVFIVPTHLKWIDKKKVELIKWKCN